METTSTRSKAMLAHASTLTQWFIPFGNFIFPLIIWSSTKRDSGYLDHHGRQSINFQLSLFLYTVVLCMIAIPILVFTVFKHVPFAHFVNDDVRRAELTPENISGIAILAIIAVVLFCFMKVAEFFLVIHASVKAIDGVRYEYPLTIPFVRASHQPADESPSTEMQSNLASSPEL